MMAERLTFTSVESLLLAVPLVPVLSPVVADWLLSLVILTELLPVWLCSLQLISVLMSLVALPLTVLLFWLTVLVHGPGWLVLEVVGTWPAGSVLG